MKSHNKHISIMVGTYSIVISVDVSAILSYFWALKVKEAITVHTKPQQKLAHLFKTVGE